MVELSILMRAEQGLAILHAAEAATATDDGTDRTRDQRRADWATEQLLADHHATPAQAPDQAPTMPPTVPAAGVRRTELVLDARRRRPVQVLVHVPVTTALGLDDAPCELERIGPIDADHGRLLLTTAELRKVCVDATTGEVLHVDDRVLRPVPSRARIDELTGAGVLAEHARAQAQAEAVRAALLDLVHNPSVLPTEPEPGYRPSAALSRTVKTRHRRCDFLTCSTSARHCDDEHTDPWPRGETSARNLAPRSRWCHRLKQNGWTPRPLPDGTTLWLSPSGRQYAAPPQHEPPPHLHARTRLRPPTAAPPRDDTGPPDGVDPELITSTDQPCDDIAWLTSLSNDRAGGPGDEAETAETDPRSSGWPEEPPF